MEGGRQCWCFFCLSPAVVGKETTFVWPPNYMFGFLSAEGDGG